MALSLNLTSWALKTSYLSIPKILSAYAIVMEQFGSFYAIRIVWIQTTIWRVGYLWIQDAKVLPWLLVEREEKGNSIQLFQQRQINVTPDSSTEEERLSSAREEQATQTETEIYRQTDRQTETVRGRERDRHTENMFSEGQRGEEGGETDRGTDRDRASP